MHLLDLFAGEAELVLVAGRDDRTGPTTLTRILRSFEVDRPCPRKRPQGRLARSVDPNASTPLIDTMEPLITIEAPSGISGNAFCTVKRVPLALTPNVLSKWASVI
jgi:hypothetical protein